MKKLITTLVALAFVAVSTVDAKKTVMKKQPAASSASQIVGNSKNALAGNGSAQTILKTIDENAQTPAEQRTAPLLAKKDMLEKEQTLLKQETTENKGSIFGWMFGRTTPEQKEAKLETAANLQKNQAELKKVNAEIVENKKEVGMTWFNAVKYGVIAAAVLGISAYEYYYYGSSRVRAMGTAAAQHVNKAYATGKEYAGKTYAAGKEYAGAAYNRGKGMASSAYESTKGAAGRAYNRVRGTTPVTAQPASQPTYESQYNPQYQ